MCEADTRVRQAGCDATALLHAIGDLALRYPHARLVRNAVGNLSVFVGDDFRGYLDLTFARFYEYDAD